MDQKIMDCFIHPIKCKLLLEVYSVGQVTAKHLADTYKDIPQATLYRHLRRMTADGILKIVEEKPIRGTLEKIYALAIDFNTIQQELWDKNSGEAYMQVFMQYILGFVKQFQDYCARPEIDIKEDMSAFTLAPIYATNEELLWAMEEISKTLMTLLNNKPANGRKLRNLGFIVSPPEIKLEIKSEAKTK